MNSRLVLRKTAEEVKSFYQLFLSGVINYYYYFIQDYRNKYYEEARKECNEFTKKFAECAQREGMGVVLKCRSENRASKYSLTLDELLYVNINLVILIVSECLDKRSDEPGFIKFMDARGYDHVKVGIPGVFFGTQEREFFRMRRDISGINNADPNTISQISLSSTK